jgi:hypothetical protein
MAKNATTDCRTYQRDDGVLMVEVRPEQFINEEAAAKLGLMKHHVLDPLQNTGSSRERQALRRASPRRSS